MPYRKIVTESSVSNKNLYCSDNYILEDIHSHNKSLNYDNNIQTQGNTYMNQSQATHNNKNMSSHFEYKNYIPKNI